MIVIKNRKIKMDITPKTRLLELLNAFPEIEPKIMTLAPPFKNLKNPVLRKTVGKLATLEKVATIGGLDVSDFMNEIRREIGLDIDEVETESADISVPEDAPEWIKGNPVHVVDGTAMLDAGEHPLNHMNKLMSDLNQGAYILLRTNFHPLPMHDAMKQQNHLVYYSADGDLHQTFVCKK